MVGWFLHLGIRAKIGVIAGIIAAIAAISVSGYLIYKRNISASTESSPVTVTLNISNAKPANAAIQESDALSTFGIYTSANATIKYVTIRGINPTFTIPISAKCESCFFRLQTSQLVSKTTGANFNAKSSNRAINPGDVYTILANTDGSMTVTLMSSGGGSASSSTQSGTKKCIKDPQDSSKYLYVTKLSDNLWVRPDTESITYNDAQVQQYSNNGMYESLCQSSQTSAGTSSGTTTSDSGKVCAKNVSGVGEPYQWVDKGLLGADFVAEPDTSKCGTQTTQQTAASYPVGTEKCLEHQSGIKKFKKTGIDTWKSDDGITLSPVADSYIDSIVGDPEWCGMTTIPGAIPDTNAQPALNKASAPENILKVPVFGGNGSSNGQSLPYGNSSIRFQVVRYSNAAGEGNKYLTPVGGVRFTLNGRIAKTKTSQAASKVEVAKAAEGSVVPNSGGSTVAMKQIKVQVNDNGQPAGSGVQVQYLLSNGAGLAQCETDRTGSCAQYIQESQTQVFVRASKDDKQGQVVFNPSSVQSGATVSVAIAAAQATGSAVPGSTGTTDIGRKLGENIGTTKEVDVKYQAEYNSWLARQKAKYSQMLSANTQSITVKGVVPDNGSRSTILITGLAAGTYNLTLSKNGYETQSDITFEIGDGDYTLPRLHIKPSPGAEPPSVENTTVTKDPRKNEPYASLYYAGSYIYKSNCPDAGWMPKEMINECPEIDYQNGSPVLVDNRGNAYTSPTLTNLVGYYGQYCMGPQASIFTGSSQNGEKVSAAKAGLLGALGGLLGSLSSGKDIGDIKFAKEILVPAGVAAATAALGGDLNFNIGRNLCPNYQMPYYPSSSCQRYNYCRSHPEISDCCGFSGELCRNCTNQYTSNPYNQSAWSWFLQSMGDIR